MTKKSSRTSKFPLMYYPQRWFSVLCEVLCHFPFPALSDPLPTPIPTSSGAQYYDIIPRLSTAPKGASPRLSLLTPQLPSSIFHEALRSFLESSIIWFLLAITGLTAWVFVKATLFHYSLWDGWKYNALTGILQNAGFLACNSCPVKVVFTYQINAGNSEGTCVKTKHPKELVSCRLVFLITEPGMT